MAAPPLYVCVTPHATQRFRNHFLPDGDPQTIMELIRGAVERGRFHAHQYHPRQVWLSTLPDGTAITLVIASHKTQLVVVTVMPGDSWHENQAAELSRDGGREARYYKPLNRRRRMDRTYHHARSRAHRRKRRHGDDDEIWQ